MNKKHGFASIFLVLIVLGVLVISGGGYYLVKRTAAPGAPAPQSDASPTDEQNLPAASPVTDAVAPASPTTLSKTMATKNYSSAIVLFKNSVKTNVGVSYSIQYPSTWFAKSVGQNENGVIFSPKEVDIPVPQAYNGDPVAWAEYLKEYASVWGKILQNSITLNAINYFETPPPPITMEYETIRTITSASGAEILIQKAKSPKAENYQGSENYQAVLGIKNNWRVELRRGSKVDPKYDAMFDQMAASFQFTQ